MRSYNETGELNEALVSNFRLKSKILAMMFGTILFFEIIAICVVALGTDLPGKVVPIKIMVIGPSILFLIFMSEVAAFRYLKKIQGKEQKIKKSLIYLSTFVETTFPHLVMLMVGTIMRDTNLFPPMQIISSPLLIIVFIMIILSSLLLDPRLCIFAGVVAGVEYMLINILFLVHEPPLGPSGYPNAILKSIFLIVCGLIAGFVSKRIREAVESSLQAKNELIHNLDQRVAEKTAELEKKNELLQEKQKEILDSIHYAKRIQFTLLPHEKYIIKTLEKLRTK